MSHPNAKLNGAPGAPAIKASTAAPGSAILPFEVEEAGPK